MVTRQGEWEEQASQQLRVSHGAQGMRWLRQTSQTGG